MKLSSWKIYLLGLCIVGFILISLIYKTVREEYSLAIINDTDTEAVVDVLMQNHDDAKFYLNSVGLIPAGETIRFNAFSSDTERCIYVTKNDVMYSKSAGPYQDTSVDSIPGQQLPIIYPEEYRLSSVISENGWCDEQYRLAKENQ